MKSMKNLIETVLRWVQNCLGEASGNRKVKQSVVTDRHVEKSPAGKMTDALMKMEDFLEKQYDFRFNKLTGETEYRMRHVTDYAGRSA